MKGPPGLFAGASRIAEHHSFPFIVFEYSNGESSIHRELVYPQTIITVCDAIDFPLERYKISIPDRGRLKARLLDPLKTILRKQIVEGRARILTAHICHDGDEHRCDASGMKGFRQFKEP